MHRATRAPAALCLLAICGGAAPASSADVDVRSATFFGGRPDVADGVVRTVVPLTQSVSLSARRIAGPAASELTVALDAWGLFDLSRLQGPGALAGDVNVAHLEALVAGRKARLRLGRQIVSGGAARFTVLDGLFAEYRGAPLGLGAAVYAGSPVARRFAHVVRGDFVAGGRVFWAPSYETEAGVSFIHVTQGAQLSRQDLGGDVRARLHRTLSAGGSLVWSVAEGRLAEIDVGPRWQPLPALEILVDYRRQAPDLLLPRTSILSVFASTSRDDVGAAVHYGVSRSVSLYAEGRALLLPAGAGYDAGLRGAWRADGAAGDTASVQLRRLDSGDNGYVQARLAGRKRLGELSLSLDLEALRLDRPVRGQDLSFSAAANASWRFAPAWLAGVTAFAATTPTFESRYELIAKLGYTFPANAFKGP